MSCGPSTRSQAVESGAEAVAEHGDCADLGVDRPRRTSAAGLFLSKITDVELEDHG